MNNLFKILLSDAYQHDWSDLEIIITIIVLCVPWIALIVYSLFKKFKITFVLSDNEEVKKYFKAKTEIIMPENPSKEGYTFLGWFNDSDFEEPFRYQNMPGKNLRVFAKWEKNE